MKFAESVSLLLRADRKPAHRCALIQHLAIYKQFH